MSSNGDSRRLLIWRGGEIFRSKISRASTDWRVVRFAPPFRGVSGTDHLIDVTRPLPFEVGAFDSIYARRIVEHLAPDEALGFAKELRRILSPGGIIRISVPDTEQLARNYLAAAQRARANPDANNIQRVHESRWFFVDQFVRRVPGGAIARHMHSGRMQPETLRDAFGDALGLNGVADAGSEVPLQSSARQRLKEFVRTLLGRRWVHETHATREAHFWIYDRYSLPKLLRDAGFANSSICRADTSAIADWGRWKFDTSDVGAHAFEPSFVVEARA